jgi:hypothetical protein
MKTETEIRNAIKACSKAQETDNPKLCPIWPKDDDLYCIDCTCRYAMRWVLGEPVDPTLKNQSSLMEVPAVKRTNLPCPKCEHNECICVDGLP